MRNLILFLLLTSAVACQTKPAPETTKTTTDKPVENTATTQVAKENYPPMSADSLRYFFLRATQVDLIFNTLGFTTNSKDINAKNNVQFFTTDAVKEQQCSAPFATMIVTGDKGVLFNAQVYFAVGCAYFQINSGGKIYANNMSAYGVTYFNQVIKSKTSK